jgi:hypothetical protein
VTVHGHHEGFGAALAQDSLRMKTSKQDIQITDASKDKKVAN